MNHDPAPAESTAPYPEQALLADLARLRALPISPGERSALQCSVLAAIQVEKHRQNRRTWRRPVRIAAGALAAAAMLLAMAGIAVDQHKAPQNQSTAAPQETALLPVDNGPAAPILRIESDNPNVVFYWIAPEKDAKHA